MLLSTEPVFSQNSFNFKVLLLSAISQSLMHIIFSIPKILHISSQMVYKEDNKCDWPANM